MEMLFYPLSTWPQDIQQLFWKKPIGDTDTFKLMLFFLGNGCSKHLINRMDSYISTLDHTTERNQESKTNELYY